MKTAIAALCVLLGLMIGCNDEDCVNCPGPAPTPTLQNIWPNPDSTSWTFDYQMREWEGEITIYPSPGQVPTKLPSWDTIFQLCRAHEPKTPFAITDRVYTMMFDGMTTTRANVTAQNLETTLEAPGGANAAPIVAPEVPALLRRLHAARPDLRDKILSSLGEIAETPAQVAESPLWIHGGPWEKSETYMGTYSDLTPRLAWKFLTNNLFTGSTFSHQLIPEYADNVFLHGRVYRRVTVETSAGTFENGLDCLYMIDYGVFTVTDQYGDPVGWARMIDYGRAIYVPDVGPVYSYERWGVEPVDPPSDGFLDITLTLTASSTLGE